MHAIVHAADIQDRDGGVLLMATLFGLYPFLLKLYADGGYQGPAFQKALARHSQARERRDRQALRSSQRLRRLAQALDRRAHLRLARTMPKAGQGLGVPQPQGARLPYARLHPPHAAKTMQSRMMFPDKLKAPAPAETVERLNREINAALADPVVKARMSRILGASRFLDRSPISRSSWPRKPRDGLA